MTLLPRPAAAHAATAMTRCCAHGAARAAAGMARRLLPVPSLEGCGGSAVACSGLPLLALWELMPVRLPVRLPVLVLLHFGLSGFEGCSQIDAALASAQP